MEEEKKNQKRVLTDEELMNVSGGSIATVSTGGLKDKCKPFTKKESCEAKADNGCYWDSAQKSCMYNEDNDTQRLLKPIIL